MMVPLVRLSISRAHGRRIAAASSAIAVALLLSAPARADYGCCILYACESNSPDCLEGSTTQAECENFVGNANTIPLFCDFRFSELNCESAECNENAPGACVCTSSTFTPTPTITPTERIGSDQTPATSTTAPHADSSGCAIAASDTTPATRSGLNLLLPLVGVAALRWRGRRPRTPY